MAFGIALSGIDAAQSDLNVTANNIANSATTGFKSSTSQFAELFAVSQQGVSNTQPGNGVRLTQVKQNFTQGNITSTGNSLDLAISGAGMFIVSDQGSYKYTRAGSFGTDNAGFVVNTNGQRLQAFLPTATGSFNTTSLADVELRTGDSAPQATTIGSLIYNLPADANAPATTPFSPADSATYNQSTSMTLYDSLGAAHTASFYFVKGAAANTWNAYQYIDGTGVNATPVQLTYTSAGALASVLDPAGGTDITKTSFGAYNPTTGAAPMNVSFDLGQTTQYGNAFGVTSVTQDGYTTGKLSGISVDSTGVIQANYTNGHSKPLGQVAIAKFANQDGLQQVGNTNWEATYASGDPLYGPAGTSGLGLIQSGSLEESNVDLTAQLVKMITTQRAFQANAQMISTENQITQSIINIRG